VQRKQSTALTIPNNPTTTTQRRTRCKIQNWCRQLPCHRKTASAHQCFNDNWLFVFIFFVLK